MNKQLQMSDLGIDSSLLMAKMSIQYAKDILSGNWHFFMYEHPNTHYDYAESFLKQAEGELYLAEVQLKTRELLRNDTK